jgi:hypothetical protein
MRPEPAFRAAGAVSREIRPIHNGNFRRKPFDFLVEIAADYGLFDPSAIGQFDVPVNREIRCQHQDDRPGGRADLDVDSPLFLPDAVLRRVDRMTCISASSSFAMLSAGAGLDFFVLASFVWTSGSRSRSDWLSRKDLDPLLLDPVRPAPGTSNSARTIKVGQ